ncbi:hypothetical protein AAC387_Pa04g2064 [Persea americana]
MKDCAKKEEIAEDYCFICKDGGLLLVCEYDQRNVETLHSPHLPFLSPAARGSEHAPPRRCLKAYHPECVGEDSSILDTNNTWICSWHKCFICKKSSKLQCFCCPNAVCQACTITAEFVQVREEKGFCSNCLKLALLIEENLDVDSDGGQVDFNDTETYECLFRDYWEIIKQNEGLSIEDLHKADSVLKKGKKSGKAFNLNKPVGELTSDVDNMDDKSDDEVPLQEPKGQDLWMKIGRRTYKSRKKKFIGWGSEQLICFLTSIGKNTDEPITQPEVYDIIKDYIVENKLTDPQKKKKVICDARLNLLFGRKAVNRLKISNLLEAHFAESQESEDDSLFGSEEENVPKDCKRQRRLSSDPKANVPMLNDFTGNVSETQKSCYASTAAKNVKLIYLRRSLIEEFLKKPETFESKVMDCFVRVKSDPNDYSVPKNFFRIEQVTGVGRASEAYKTGEISTDIVLQVSNMMKGICIFMLSDDDFSEEECDDLRQRVKEGLLERLTIVELDKKARSLHEDITNHWIDREIVVLQKRIDRANEKGWRRELFEYIERRQLLQTPSERSRLLNELPKVIADAEVELEETPNSQENVEVVFKGNGALSLQKAISRETKGFWVACNEKAVEKESEDFGAASLSSPCARDKDFGVASLSSPRPRDEDFGVASLSSPRLRDKGNGAVSIQNAGTTGTEESTSSIHSFFFGDDNAPNDKFAKTEAEGNGTTPDIEVAKNDTEAIEATSRILKPVLEQQCEKESSSKKVLKNVIDIDEDVADPCNRAEGRKQEIPVIDLDDENDENTNDANGAAISKPAEEANPTENNPRFTEEKRVETNPEARKIWYYMDPKGEIQGPFSMRELKFWKGLGWFDENFMVWVTGRSREDAISLKDAIRLTSI